MNEPLMKINLGKGILNTRAESKALKEIAREYVRATEKFGGFATTHEGYAVILEELDELWDEIKANSTKKAMRKEAMQLSAMAFRFMVDCC